MSITQKVLKPFIAAIASAALSCSALAGVITVENYGSGTNAASESGTLGGYVMTRFDLMAVPSPDPRINTLASPVDGSTVGITSNESDGKVKTAIAYQDSAPTTTDPGVVADPNWWTNYSGYDYNVFTTTSNTITLILPENTLALAFNVGANQRGRAWFNAYDQNGALDYASGNFYVGGSGNKTPGYGLYADNTGSTAGDCNYISKVVVDPTFIWGLGNLSIAQDTSGNCTTEVPEPSTLALFGLGLFGLNLARRRLV